MNFTMTPPPVNPMYDIVGGTDITPTYEETQTARATESALRAPWASIGRMEDLYFAGKDDSYVYKDKADWEESEQYRDGLEYRDGFNVSAAQMTAESYDLEQKRNEAIQNFEGSYWESSKLLGTDLWQQMKDPLNIGSAFIPIMAGTKVAQIARTGANAFSRTGARMAVGAVEGAVGNAIVEPLVLAAATMEQASYTAKESALNIALGVPLGGIFHAGVGGAIDIAKGVVGISPLARSKMVDTAKSQTIQDRNIEVDPIRQMDEIYNEDQFKVGGAREMVMEMDPDFVGARIDATDIIAVEGARRNLIETPDDFYTGIVLTKDFDNIVDTINTTIKTLVDTKGDGLAFRINLEEGLHSIKKDIAKMVSKMTGKEFTADDDVVRQWTSVVVSKLLDGDIKVKSGADTVAITKKIQVLSDKITKLNMDEFNSLTAKAKLDDVEIDITNKIANHQKDIIALTDEMEGLSKLEQVAYRKQIIDKKKRIAELNKKLPGLNKKRNVANTYEKFVIEKERAIADREALVREKEILEEASPLEVDIATREALSDTLADLPEPRLPKAERLRKVMENNKEADYIDAREHAKASARMDEQNAKVSGKEEAETFLEELDVKNENTELEARLRRETVKGNTTEEFNAKLADDLDDATLSDDILADDDILGNIKDCVIGEVG